MHILYMLVPQNLNCIRSADSNETSMQGGDRFYCLNISQNYAFINNDMENIYSRQSWADLFWHIKAKFLPSSSKVYFSDSGNYVSNIPQNIA